ncbi:MAG: hypothetical protein Kow0062_08860 [Acidobacteriota bacterium]|nr:MAG: hypothetical protein D6738_01655 [Acidobacteriota bacterium]
MPNDTGSRQSLDRLIKEFVTETIETLRPRSGQLRELVEEVRALRRDLTALEKRVAGRAKRRAASGKRKPGRPPIHTQCTVSGCNRAHYAKGLCSMHYQNWRRTGKWPGPANLDPARKGSRKTSAAKKKTTRRKKKTTRTRK